MCLWKLDCWLKVKHYSECQQPLILVNNPRWDTLRSWRGEKNLFFFTLFIAVGYFSKKMKISLIPIVSFLLIWTAARHELNLGACSSLWQRPFSKTYVLTRLEEHFSEHEDSSPETELFLDISHFASFPAEISHFHSVLILL